MSLSRPVNTSLEIGGSVFNSLKALRGLIAATSEDDVHTQAVLAAEQLGACIPVSIKRIDEAVNALGGQDSVRIENLKASVGISAGGLCKVIRQSTSLLQLFLMCAACKTTLLDEDCSTLIYEMLKASSVLARLPCSAVQIMRLITQFSGQAEMIAPADMMHAVASTVDEWDPEPDVFQKMDLKLLAELLITLFDHMRDDTVDSILLEGHDNSIWLASCLLWLLEDRAWLLIGDKAVKGNPKSKLCVKIEPKSNAPWSLQVWKANADPLDFVFESATDETDTLHQIPLRSVKSFMNQYYWSSFEDPQVRRKAMVTSGILAQTLTVAIQQRGKVYLNRKCCQGQSHCSETPLTNIAQSSWLSAVERAVTKYGWDDQVKFDATTLAAIIERLENWELMPETGKTFEEAERAIKEPCQALINSHFPGEDIEADYILDPALFVAADATVTCTAFLETGRRYIRPLDDESIQFADQTVIHVLSDGLDISEFRRRAFKQLLPGLETMHDGDLVVSRDGYVVGMNMLWAESPLQSNALSIRVQRGHIKKDQVTYNSIRENPFNSIVLHGPRVPAFDPVKGLVLPEVGWQHPIKDRAYTFETAASTPGTRVEIKHYMAYIDSITKRAVRRKASWIAAINVLATAIHMDLEHQLVPRQNEALSTRIMARLMGADVCWTDPFSSPKVEAGIKTLIRTDANPKVKIFGAGVCNEFSEHCCSIVIRHRSPLLQCIEKAESNRETWIVVY